uniref:Secreted protein n=1 Tax=Heterorhabditis bacteriophora TaxID=37862 RepID=A0A1I7X7Z5_HETBA
MIRANCISKHMMVNLCRCGLEELVDVHKIVILSLVTAVHAVGKATSFNRFYTDFDKFTNTTTYPTSI